MILAHSLLPARPWQGFGESLPHPRDSGFVEHHFLQLSWLNGSVTMEEGLELVPLQARKLITFAIEGIPPPAWSTGPAARPTTRAIVGTGRLRGDEGAPKGPSGISFKNLSKSAQTAPLNPASVRAALRSRSG